MYNTLFIARIFFSATGFILLTYMFIRTMILDAINDTKNLNNSVNYIVIGKICFKYETYGVHDYLRYYVSCQFKFKEKIIKRDISVSKEQYQNLHVDDNVKISINHTPEYILNLTVINC